MTDLTKYNPSIAWRTLAANVYQLSIATVDTPATYRISVSVIDTNDKGQSQKSNGFYFTDYFGVPFRIIGTDTNTIDVSDDFRTGFCPTSGREGWVHKSAYKGNSIALPANLFWNLHPLAQSNNNKYAVSILWGNDPNPKRITVTSSDTPAITNYQGTQGDGSKLFEDYGENPKIQLFQIDDSGNLVERTEKPYFVLSTGLIDSINFGTLPDPISGFITISR